tara:strand:+ start:20362 stop:20874 length:513 start_codon:yes stop_codon:yes gene_type:complete
MSKVIDWDKTYQGPVRKTAGKYASGKEYMAKAQESLVHEQQAQEALTKAQPAMEALLKCRMMDKTPLKVLNALPYMANEMITQYGQISDPNGGWMDDLDDARGSYFNEVQKSVRPGTELILKSLDPNLQEFVFEDQHGNEVAIPYSAKPQLMTHTNIYQDVLNFINSKGE